MYQLFELAAGQRDNAHAWLAKCPAMPYVTGGSGSMLPKAQVSLFDDDHDIIGGSWK